MCAKVARYSERIHHPDRLTQPLVRVGPKGSGQFAPIGWDEALERVAEAFLEAERRFGCESVWPYFYSGTMGLVMRDGIERLTHAKRYSQFHGTICVGIAWPGYVAGTGRLIGADPREMEKSDCIVIWGSNAVATQVNVMTHAVRARKARGAKIVAIDIYETETMRQADLALRLRPGTDGALACAVMHVLFRDRLADRDYLERYTDAPDELEAHVLTPWPALGGGDHRPRGRGDRNFRRDRRLDTSGRSSASAMASRASATARSTCTPRSRIPAVTGAWAHEGGGAFHSNSGIFKLRKTHDRGPGCPRFARAPPRPVPGRRRPDR